MVYFCHYLLFSTFAQPAIISPLLDELRVFFILAVVVFVGALKKSKTVSWKGVPQIKLVLLLLAAYTLSEAQHLWLPGTFMTFSFWAKKVMVFYAIVVLIDTPQKLKTALWSTVLACSVLTAYALDFYITDPTLSEFDGRLESVGHYNLSNSYALLLSVCWPLTFTLFEMERSVIKRAFLLVNMVVFFGCDLLTRSRGGILGMSLGICLSLLLSRHFLRNKMMKIMAVGGVVCLVGSLGIALVMQRSDVSGMLGGDTSAGDRMMVWVAAFNMLKSRPLFGVGWSHFYEVVTDYGADRHLLAHNTVISVFAETGLFGGICFLLLIKACITQMYRIYRSQPADHDNLMTATLATGLMISLSVFLFNTSFSVKDHDPTFWMLVSLITACHRIYITARESSKSKEMSIPDTFSSTRVLQPKENSALL